MDKIINLHVVDPENIGDLYSAPARYFKFPGFQVEVRDILQLETLIQELTRTQDTTKVHVIIGGGGLLFKKFLSEFQRLPELSKNGRLIAWGVGAQQYSEKPPQKAFDYSQYLQKFDVVGIRDFPAPYHWVPCASCLHPAFDKPRSVKHEVVVFSHKKFRIRVQNLPFMTNQSSDFEKILDFLGSGETVLTSSYHGVYWSLLLGRKVIAVPFTSKFFTLKHRPSMFMGDSRWQPNRLLIQPFKKSVLNRLKIDYYFDKNLRRDISGWENLVENAVSYPGLLNEYLLRNKEFYDQVLRSISEG
jgi:hypothetical protein